MALYIAPSMTSVHNGTLLHSPSSSNFMIHSSPGTLSMWSRWHQYPKLFSSSLFPASPQGTYCTDSDSESWPHTHTSPQWSVHMLTASPPLLHDTPTDGRVTEQFDKGHQHPSKCSQSFVGYVVMLTAFHARKGGSSGTWGAENWKSSAELPGHRSKGDLALMTSICMLCCRSLNDVTPNCIIRTVL